MTDFSSTQDSAAAVLVQPDGKIVVVGTPNSIYAVARLTSTGSLDNSFDGDGKVTTITADYASVARDSDGMLVVGGWTEVPSTGDDFSLVRYNAGGLDLEERLYAQQDHNFNITSLTDSAGAIVQRFVYDPCGAATLLTASWAGGSDDHNWAYLHQGGRLDSISGLHHFRRRDYSPTLGRWMQQDPAGYVDGMSLYQYETSSPVSALDPNGWVAWSMSQFHQKLDPMHPAEPRAGSGSPGSQGQRFVEYYLEESRGWARLNGHIYAAIAAPIARSPEPRGTGDDGIIHIILAGFGRGSAAVQPGRMRIAASEQAAEHLHLLGVADRQSQDRGQRPGLAVRQAGRSDCCRSVAGCAGFCAARR